MVLDISFVIDFMFEISIYNLNYLFVNLKVYEWFY